MTTDSTVTVLPIRPAAMRVGEFNRAVKSTLEAEFPSTWIEGEIASCKIAASGHAYFDLKDDGEDARISCCLFRNSLARVKDARIKDGERVIVRAKATLYPARGQFQLVVDSVLGAGAGNAAAQLEALKRLLHAEGLMDPARKRALPRFPRVIGVVTSIAGAAFGDICRVVHRRYPAHIVIAPTLVQGAEAPLRIVAALRAIQRLEKLDVVIVGRGGGASDDLSAFNDERVARAVAACRVPVVSAVGHEIDHTVVDLVADVRASTPSNAAEMVVPEWRAVRDELQAVETRLGQVALARVNARRVQLARLDKRLGDPRRITDDARQRLDDALARMGTAVRRTVTRGRRTLDEYGGRLRGAHPRTRLARDRGALLMLAQKLGPAAERLIGARVQALMDAHARLGPAMRARMQRERATMGTRAAQLDALSPLAILGRGYGVVLHEGRAVVRAKDVPVGGEITVRVHEGTLSAVVSGTSE